MCGERGRGGVEDKRREEEGREEKGGGKRVGEE